VGSATVLLYVSPGTVWMNVEVYQVFS